MKHNTMSKRLRGAAAALSTLLAAAALVALLASCEDEDDTYVTELVYDYETVTTDVQLDAVAVVFDFSIDEDTDEVTTNYISYDGTKYSFDWMDPGEIENDLISTGWFSSGEASAGDVAFRYTFSASDLKAGVTLSLVDSDSGTFGWQIGDEVGDEGSPWGTLVCTYSGTTVTGLLDDVVVNGAYSTGGAEATWVSPSSLTVSGTAELVCMRVGSVLVINATLLQGETDTAASTYTVVVKGFSENELTIELLDSDGDDIEADFYADLSVADEVTTNYISYDGTKYSFDWGTSTAMTNNDSDGDTWWNGATSTVSLSSGDFALRFTWENTRDPDYSDVVLEFYNSSGYFDWTVGVEPSVGDPWGLLVLNNSATDWASGISVESAFTADGETGTNWVSPGAITGDFGGTYEVVVLRTGTTLIINATILHDSGGYVVSTYTVVVEGFTTAALTGLLNGNPYWIDDPYYATATISKSTVSE